MVSYVMLSALRDRYPRLVPRLPSLLGWLITTALVVLAWVFFRAPSLGQAIAIVRSIVFHAPGEFIAGLSAINTNQVMLFLQAPGNQPAFIGFIAAALMFFFEARKYDSERLAPTLAGNGRVDFGLYFLLVLATLIFGEFGRSTFIYFQF
jgi:alginate O-acetyltransferase complex protein AlgI